MVSVLASSAVDCKFELRLGQTKDYKIGICCFFAKHATVRKKSKDWLAQNQKKESDGSNMSSRDCSFSELALTKFNSACWSSTMRASSSSH